MLTKLTIRNFKLLDDVEVPLGSGFVFVGPNNSGKTTALQALTLWHTGLKKWLGRQSGNGGKKNTGIPVNRLDLIDVPVAHMDLIWRSRKVRKATNQKILIDIVVEGISHGKEWQCGLEFEHSNNETFFCRPLREDSKGEKRMAVPEYVKGINVVFLPPMSGLASEEPLLQQGRIHVLMGQGQTAEVLRNLCYNVSSKDDNSDWQAMVWHIKDLFGVVMHDPQFDASRGSVVMAYTDTDGKTRLDLPSSGRGMQQALLLLAYLYDNPPNTVFLLDEPDAHLEILRQNESYKRINDIADERDAQIIAASHSDALLDSSVKRKSAVAFLGAKPRPYVLGKDKKAHVMDALSAIGFQDYYKAEQKGWVLYLEGDTDLSILQAFAKRLDHPAQTSLKEPFVLYVGNQPQDARKHFHSLQAAKEDLQGFLVLDKSDKGLEQAPNLQEYMWQKNEIENYLCQKEALVAYVKAGWRHDDMFDESHMKEYENIIRAEIDKLVEASQTLGQPEPFSDDIKASNQFLQPLFKNFTERLGMKELPYRYRKTHFYRLVDYMPKDEIDSEVIQVLDSIYKVHEKAQKNLR